MPWEHIGSCGTGQLPDDREWIISALEICIAYLRAVAPEPEGSELGIMWNEHELGDYPSIGLLWPESIREPPMDYVCLCSDLLGRFDLAVSWSEISPDGVADLLDDPAEDEEDVENEDYLESPHVDWSDPVARRKLPPDAVLSLDDGAFVHVLGTTDEGVITYGLSQPRRVCSWDFLKRGLATIEYDEGRRRSSLTLLTEIGGRFPKEENDTEPTVNSHVRNLLDVTLDVTSASDLTCALGVEIVPPAVWKVSLTTGSEDGFTAKSEALERALHSLREFIAECQGARWTSLHLSIDRTEATDPRFELKLTY